jgi:protein-disulfide isomerase
MYLFAWRRFIRPLYYPLASHRLLRPGGCFLTVCVIMLSTAVSCPSSLAAEPRVNPAAPNKALVKEVTEAVIKSLGENEQLLDKAVERGIQRYIDRQRAEQDKARAEQARQVQETAKKVRRPSPDRDHIRGNPRATISLIEYSDFECPFCKRFHETPGKLLETHKDQLNWVYRHYPLGFHNPGGAEAGGGHGMRK